MQFVNENICQNIKLFTSRVGTEPALSRLIAGVRVSGLVVTVTGTPITKIHGDPESGQQLFGLVHNKISQGEIYMRGPSEPSSSQLHSPHVSWHQNRAFPAQRSAVCGSVWIISSARRNLFIRKRQISLLPPIITKCKYISHKTKMTKNKSSRMKLELHETNDINKSISAGLPVQKKAKINDKTNNTHDPKDKLEWKERTAMSGEHWWCFQQLLLLQATAPVSSCFKCNTSNTWPKRGRREIILIEKPKHATGNWSSPLPRQRVTDRSTFIMSSVAKEGLHKRFCGPHNLAASAQSPRQEQGVCWCTMTAEKGQYC